MDAGNNEARRTNQERGEDVAEQRGLLRRVQKDTVWLAPEVDSVEEDHV